MDALNQADAPAARKRMQAHFANGLKAAG